MQYFEINRVGSITQIAPPVFGVTRNNVTEA
jgi:hypothetical protein